MGAIERFMSEYPEWLERNFPGTSPTLQLLGVGEEYGELCHAELKGQQGIRHTPAAISNMKADAVADVFIFLVGYCHASGIDFEKALDVAWTEVKARDWRVDPMTGQGELDL